MRQPKFPIQDLAHLAPWEWPSGTGRLVADTIIDKTADPEDRLTAMHMAGDLVLMNDGMAALLLSAVENPAETTDLRAQAAISLGPALDEASLSEFDDEDLAPSISEEMFHRIGLTLMKVYGDANAPKELRRRALEAAVRSPEDWHTEAIRTAFASGDAEWKLTAVFGMQYVRGFDQEVLAMLNSTDLQLRTMAVTAAGNGELKAAWPHIERMLSTHGITKPLLLAAIEAAASINPSEAVPILQDLEDSRDPEIAEAASDALMMARLPDDNGEEDDSRDWLN